MPVDVLLWVVLVVVVGGMLALDLLILNRDAKPVPFGRAAAWSTVWVSIALAFGAFVTLTRGSEAGGEYLAGYLIELSLSVDNLFVFALIFSAFAVPAAYQHRLLFWGILGAVVFRAAFIVTGTAILSAAHWVIYLLGVLLIVTGIRLARSRGHAVSPERNPVLRLFRRFVPTTDDYRGPAFIVRENGRRLATPLLAALVAVETTDIMFALDSIPAVFAITTDPLIVFSSNLFAILGLRSLYFLLAGLIDRFIYLKLGLAALLVFAGAKIIAELVHIEIPIAVSLAVIAGILGTAIVASLIATHPRREELVQPLVRIASGLGLGFAALGVLMLPAASRDPSMLWLVLELALIAGVLAAATIGLVWFRRIRTRSPLVRAWVSLGVAAALVVALLVMLD
ncbi:MAG TPA: TerC family protein [Candidatus Limnocylindrales bacterium]|nr:TerC family protein [Candidatus Limnocylindrales bacterium]